MAGSIQTQRATILMPGDFVDGDVGPVTFEAFKGLRDFITSGQLYGIVGGTTEGMRPLIHAFPKDLNHIDKAIQAAEAMNEVFA